MRKGICVVLAALVTLSAVLCGCGQASKDLVTVRLNEVTHSVFYAPQYVAMELGFFAE